MPKGILFFCFCYAQNRQKKTNMEIKMNESIKRKKKNGNVSKDIVTKLKKVLTKMGNFRYNGDLQSEKRKIF